MPIYRQTVAMAFFCASLGASACENPALPVIPVQDDGQRRTRQIERDTEAYLEGMAEYVACVQNEFDIAVAAGVQQEQLALLALRNNNAVAEFVTITNVYIDRVGPIEDLDLRRFRQLSQSANAGSSGGTDAATADASSEIFREGGDRCISVAGLRMTSVASDRAVMFYRRSGRVFLNVLDESCPGLHPRGGFAYEARGGRSPTLCELDLIYPTALGGEGTGVACGLGQFYEISESQAEAILDPAPVSGPNSAVTMEPIDPR